MFDCAFPLVWESVRSAMSSLSAAFREWNVNAIEMGKQRHFPCAVNFMRCETRWHDTTSSILIFIRMSMREIYFWPNNHCASTIYIRIYNTRYLLREVKAKLIITLVKKANDERAFEPFLVVYVLRDSVVL